MLNSSLIMKNLKHVFHQKKLDSKEDLFERGYKYETIRIDNTYPNFIFNNQDKLKEFIYNE